MNFPTTDALHTIADHSLRACGAAPLGTGPHTARTPITGTIIGAVAASVSVATAVDRASAAFLTWRTTPAPVRGELVRRLGEQLRTHKADLARLVQLEAGKIESEALGEVQEMIDICDYAVGLSRQLQGLTIASERPGHRLMEQWLPLGPTVVISAFNFPVAVWAWNAALALVCGNPVLWKPSELTPLTALATDALLQRAAMGLDVPAHLNQVLLGDGTVGAELVAHEGVPLVSATGSTAMGRKVGPVVAARFGRSILELGGNNAAIIAPSADAELVVRGVTFSAAGTAGQRCTSLRRLIVHTSRLDEVVSRLSTAFASLPVGSPLDKATLVGPLVTVGSLDRMHAAIHTAQADGGTVVVGGERHFAEQMPDAAYVRPAIVAMPGQTAIVHTETFAPILYVMAYDTFDEAVHLHNEVPQGLASSIFTTDLRDAERFMSAAGSDCGIANVNIGPSGAEIGGAFGGEKSTGGGRESGSDAWKGYMRRATNTINYSNELPLAQGVEFG
ncbi:MAG: aldehyde dehydrogenase family protein [Actinobacteria bacterium]|uniref:aldehyde dehydrogenase (NAD(+)) n=1 Tax=freshwater metagenome TaxID=449393 RepID=A0A6J6YEH5_9ZZZZ|nr:aldehyde dehydrogenase family protein [Actinomycetota bacterium]MSW77310.1 aldehyde dehydrogenase family protein [Actinomycetota bacterium]MSX55222.1 aldehyde dehydrogenase family protein [Actinomycetota bacterium]MSX92300.1 aldehyde dehydrogenase family protein [Actinomycetota bacterium]MSZ82759.1 aldehyde dehydrogenase family protein [Actinomycetota bacterium]